MLIDDDKYENLDPIDQNARIDACVAKLKALASISRKAGFLSRKSDETLDDIATGDLASLLGLYWVGRVLQKRRVTGTGSPMLEQAKSVEQASEAFLAFVDEVAKPAGLLSPFDLRRYEAIVASKRSTASAEGADPDASAAGEKPAGRERARMPAALSAGRSGGMDGSSERDEKIRRAKADAADKARLRALAAEEQRIRRAGAKEGGADGVGSALGAVDEEQRRERAMLMLQVASRQAVDDLVSLQEQVLFLGMMASRGAPGPGAGAGAGAAFGARGRGAAGPGAPFGARRGPAPDDPSVRPDRPGVAMMRVGPGFEVDKQKVRAGVFGHSHQLPTMTLAELGDKERAEAMEREARQREAATGAEAVMSERELHEQGREDEEEAADRSTLKERRDADIRDSVVKGAGRTKRI